MMRDIYMESILQLQRKGFNLPRNWQPLTVFSILYVMFLCPLERIGCYEWKETLHLISGMNLDWKLLCRTSVKSLGPLPSLCLWMKRREPHALLLLLLLLSPSWGLHPFLCWGDWGTNNPLLVKRPWPRKAFGAINALARDISAALSILPLSLQVSKSTCEAAARQRSWLVPVINRPLKWSLTSLHAFPTLLLTPETLHPAARTGLTLFLYQDVLIKKKNQTNQRKLYYQTIALTAKSLFFYSFIRTTICFWLKSYSQQVFRRYKIIQNLFWLTKFHICF